MPAAERVASINNHPAARRGRERANAPRRLHVTAMSRGYPIGATPPPAHRPAAPTWNMDIMSSQSLSPVDPVKPVAGYLGGKRNLSKRLVALIETVPHDCYAEPFVGMGGIFLRRTSKPQSEVINDWSSDVATFFRILQRHYVAFIDMLRFEITTRKRFEDLSQTDPKTLTDLERAARFLYLQKLAFGGKVYARGFGVQTTGGARFNMSKLVPMLEDVHERLSGVVIERLQWADFIRRYDRPHTLFYLDPPYYGCETDYGPDMFSRDQFEAMAELLDTISGRFILSLNDTPEVRRIFDRFDIEEVATTYSVRGGAHQKKVTELVISRLGTTGTRGRKAAA